MTSTQNECSRDNRQNNRIVESREFDLIIANYANGDMAGHTGKLEPTIKAVEFLTSASGN